jgi:hypothetical protein
VPPNKHWNTGSIVGRKPLVRREDSAGAGKAQPSHPDMNVNGLAAGIELYRGECALKPAGAPGPVRRTGDN